MKKILFIIDTLVGGGAEKSLIKNLQKMDEKKFQIELLVLSHNGIYFEDIPSYVKLYLLEEKYGFAFKFYKKSGITFFLKKQIPIDILRSKYDAIISYLEGLSLLYHSTLIKNTKNNVSWVHTSLPHYHWTKNTFFKKDEHKFYKKMNTVVHVSSISMSEFDKWYTECNNKTIHNLIDRDEIVRLSNIQPAEYSKFTVCLVGSLYPVKGFDLAIEVANILVKKGFDIDFNIIGEGHLRKELENLIEMYGLKNNVKLLGFHKPPYNLMKNSDVFLSTSHIEGYHLVIYEAFCLGLPVVSTKTAGAIEALGDNKYGVLVERNPEEIAQVIIDFYINTDKKENYRQLSLKKSKELNYKKIIKEIENLITL